jgi:hypothetical protein
VFMAECQATELEKGIDLQPERQQF